VNRFYVRVILLSTVFGLCLPATSQLSDNSPMGNIGAGSTIVVNQPIVIPANEEVVYFQNGVLTSWHDVDRDSPSCRLLVSTAAVVRSLSVGRKFVVTSTGFGNGLKNYSNTLFFRNDSTVEQLQCTVGNDGSGNLSVGELKIQLGNLFSLSEAAPIPG
jgi:hypothetical protein